MKYVTRGVLAPKGRTVRFWARGKGSTNKRHAWIDGDRNWRWMTACISQRKVSKPMDPRYRYDGPKGRVCGHCMNEVVLVENNEEDMKAPVPQVRADSGAVSADSA